MVGDPHRAPYALIPSMPSGVFHFYGLHLGYKNTAFFPEEFLRDLNGVRELGVHPISGTFVARAGIIYV